MLHAQYNMNMAAMPFCRMDQFSKMPMQMQMPMQTSIPSQMYAPHAFEGILELRKEKSRDAARSRRGKENYEFYELAKMLPLPGAITSQLDKASIIRLTISYLKLKDFSAHGDPPWQRDSPHGKAAKASSRRRNMSASMPIEMFETYQGTHILQKSVYNPGENECQGFNEVTELSDLPFRVGILSLDGFAMALSNDARFLYISETVSIYLGLSQVEMAGSSIFDYIHVDDHQELAEQLGLNNQGIYTHHTSTSTEDGANSTSSTPRAVTPTLPERTSIMNPSPSKGFDRCFCIRMKSTLTKRGVHVRSSGYRVVQILGHMRPQYSLSFARKHPPPLLGFVALAIALPPPTMTELVIDNDMFVTRLSPKLKVTYCEPRISDLMDMTADDLTNKNLYDYCHAEDLQKLRKSHVDLLGKGQVLTDYYRLMNKHGGFVWMQTCATIICNSKNTEEQNIIAINYVLSGVEYGGCVMNMTQLKVVTKTEPDQSDHSENEHATENEPKKKNHEKHSGAREKNSESKGQRGNKRKNSPAVEDRMTDSPVNSFDLLYQKHKNLAKESQCAVNGVILHPNSDKNMNLLDKNKAIDLKTSRRKNEKPRKRKRDQMEAEGNKSDLSLGAVQVGNDLDLDLTSTVAQNDLNSLAMTDSARMAPVTASRPNSSHSLVTPPSPVSHDLGTGIQAQPLIQSSPAPEDLSIRTSASPLLPACTSTSSALSHDHIQPPNLDHATLGAEVSSSAVCTAPQVSVTSDILRQSWINSSMPAAPVMDESLTEIPTSSGSSVRDLEEAMNKHLPMIPGESEHIRASLAAAADYNQSMLGLHQKHKSTIQWIGSPGHSGTDTLPATNLLRSLYVNRESVIRPNIYNPRPQYYGADMQNSLLTPPGGTTDPYKENFSGATLSQPKSPQNSANYPGLISNYSTSPISVAMATTSMSDAYAMTPPSSVSPQEKYATPYVDQYGDMSMTSLRGYGGHDNSLTMPIKPQAYPLPAHANSHISAYDRSAQYTTPTGYYSSSFPHYNHPTSPSPAHYRDMRTSNVW